jgi:hypothetical protein
MAVVGDYDMDPERFTQLKTRMDRNPVFKSRVNQEYARVRRAQSKQERALAKSVDAFNGETGEASSN